MQTRNVI